MLEGDRRGGGNAEVEIGLSSIADVVARGIDATIEIGGSNNGAERRT